MMNSYYAGAQVRISGHFRNAAGADADPTVITIKTKDPSGSVTTYTYPASVDKDAVGYYHKDITPSSAGVWWYQVNGLGAVVAQDEGRLNVLTSQF